MDIESNSVNDELELVFCHDAINNNWDVFLSNVSGVHFEQTSLWAKVSLQNNFCISYILVLLFQSSQIVGGSLVLIRQYGKMGRIGIVSQGPCFIHENEKYSHKIIEGFKSLVASEKLMYLTVDVLNTLQTFSVKLLHNGFLRHPKHIPPHPIIESTLLLNLQASEDDIFAQFEPSRRRNIRAGLKFNFHTKVGTRDDIPVFFNLMIETCKRRNTRPIFSDIKYFYSVWDRFSPKGWVMIHLAEVNDKPICAAFCFCFGNTFRYDLWGWNGQYANQKISETFQWKNILYAKNMGFKYYDFVQIDPIVANAIKSGAQVSDKIKSRELYGATEFKLRYGGDAVIYPGFFTCFANEFYRFLVVALFKTKRLFS